MKEKKYPAQLPDMMDIGFGCDRDLNNVWGYGSPGSRISVGQAIAGEARIRNSMDDVSVPSQN